MRLTRFADSVVVWAPAKINLFLEVMARRADGYHEIATLMVAVSLFDTLVMREEAGQEIRLSCSRSDLSDGEDNLVMRAARLLQRRSGKMRSAKIRLVKRIPMQAGLGGGSSDAAAALAGLNLLWKLDFKNHDLAALGAELGSDVPFFFDGCAAWCTGRGEKVNSQGLVPWFYAVLICPDFGCSTAEVFKRMKPPEQPKSADSLIEALQAGDSDRMGPLLFNRLYPAALEIAPVLESNLEMIRRLEPAGQLMSGSGSTLFALCRNHAEARRVAAALRASPDAPKVFVVRSCVH